MQKSVRKNKFHFIKQIQEKGSDMNLLKQKSFSVNFKSKINYAFLDKKMAEKFQTKYGGEIMNFNDALAKAKEDFK